MKINILIDDPSGVREGWTNVDPAAPESDHTRIRLNPTGLQPIADAGEVEEIVAHGVIDTVPHARADEVLAHWASRLAHGGTITLSCVDVMEVARCLVNRVIDPDAANRLLHGEQDKPWRFRQCNFTLAQLAGKLRGLGLRVVKQRVHQIRALVVAKRP